MNDQIEKLCTEYIRRNIDKPLTFEMPCGIHCAYEAGFLKACELAGLTSIAAMLPTIAKGKEPA